MLDAAPDPRPDAEVRRTRGEALIDAADLDRPPEKSRPFHGEARLSVGLGMVLEDPTAAIAPAVHFDLRQHVPIEFRIGTAFRIEMFDRDPTEEGVLRRRDWDEAGDFLTILQRFEYQDAFAFGRTGSANVDLRAGQLGRVQLGHGSLVRGFHNSLDLDRRRTGVDVKSTVDALLLRYPAGLELELAITDLSGFQILGSRVGGRWAGAGLGFSVVGDPTAPRRLAVDATDPQAFAVGRGRRLRSVGPTGVAALALDLSYLATDHWVWLVQPYVDLALVPRLGHGVHVGLDGELTLGRRRRVRIGAIGELTVGSRGYDPAYFDVFYLAQRWQAPFVGRPEDRPADLGADALPKYAFVQREDLGGVGGYGALRFAHGHAAWAELGYQARPGPLGQTVELRVGVDTRLVETSVLYAHRGRHGFEPRLAGTLALWDLRVPVLRYLDVEAAAGWTFAIRPDPEGTTTSSAATAHVAGGGFFLAGVAGRVPW